MWGLIPHKAGRIPRRRNFLNIRKNIQRQLKILFLSSEVSPFLKSGGLADVAGALPEALYRLAPGEIDIRVLTTGFGGIRHTSGISFQKEFLFSFPGGKGDAEVFQAGSRPDPDGLRVTFLDPLRLFDRPGLYGEDGVDYPDNFRRFVLWSYAIREWMREESFHPDIVHGNDWQTGLFLALLEYWKKTGRDPWTTRSLFTIHNLAYKGLFPLEDLPLTGLSPDYGHFSRLEFYGKLAFIKGGICCADRVTTVSPTYREEILFEPLGEGLSGALRERGENFLGILNGIDDRVWDPETDPALERRFSVNDLSGRTENRRSLLEQFSLPELSGVPVFGMVTRLAEQKGVDLALGAIRSLLDEGIDFRMIILGSGTPELEKQALDVARNTPGKVAVRIGFDDALARRIFAGSDFFLMPSRFEPCGLSQMYAMRYGAIPLVNPTGGLKDTVDPSRTGLWLEELSVKGVADGMKKAIQLYAKKSLFRQFVLHAMRTDNSWKERAKEYLEAYDRLFDNR
jgi:starch synthase